MIYDIPRLRMMFAAKTAADRTSHDGCPVRERSCRGSTAESDEVIDDGCARLRKSSYARLRFWRR